MRVKNEYNNCMYSFFVIHPIPLIINTTPEIPHSIGTIIPHSIGEFHGCDTMVFYRNIIETMFFLWENSTFHWDHTMGNCRAKSLGHGFLREPLLDPGLHRRCFVLVTKSSTWGMEGLNNFWQFSWFYVGCFYMCQWISSSKHEVKWARAHFTSGYWRWTQRNQQRCHFWLAMPSLCWEIIWVSMDIPIVWDLSGWFFWWWNWLRSQYLSRWHLKAHGLMALHLLKPYLFLSTSISCGILANVL